MPRYRVENGKQIAFSEAEETARDAEEKAWADGKADREIKRTIRTLEAEITQRRQREAGSDDAGGSQSGRDWMKAQEAKIATERGKL
tara:strand:+ start:390 stop:650 length:261 start_codon:yes stop_codon:yes gene_type:complete